MKRITWNSPVVLTFALVSGIVLILGMITGSSFTSRYFMIYFTSWKDPLFYLRLFTHVLGHASLEHYANNMMIFLLVGPLLEEKYGSKRLI